MTEDLGLYAGDNRGCRIDVLPTLRKCPDCGKRMRLVGRTIILKLSKSIFTYKIRQNLNAWALYRMDRHFCIPLFIHVFLILTLLDVDSDRLAFLNKAGHIFLHNG